MTSGLGAATGQKVWPAINRMAVAAGRVESTMQPGWLRRMFGGVNREHCRAVIAVALEESVAVRRVLKDAHDQALVLHEKLKPQFDGTGDEAATARSQASQLIALVGTCDRVRAIVDRWRDAAQRHQDGEIGAGEKLLSVTRRLRVLTHDLKKHA